MSSECFFWGCKMTEDYLVYAFTLIYTPTPEGVSSIVRTNDATVCIECHYLRCVVYYSSRINVPLYYDLNGNMIPYALPTPGDSM